jgi:hypothetical protein
MAWTGPHRWLGLSLTMLICGCVLGCKSGGQSGIVQPEGAVFDRSWKHGPLSDPKVVDLLEQIDIEGDPLVVVASHEWDGFSGMPMLFVRLVSLDQHSSRPSMLVKDVVMEWAPGWDPRVSSIATRVRVRNSDVRSSFEKFAESELWRCAVPGQDAGSEGDWYYSFRANSTVFVASPGPLLMHAFRSFNHFESLGDLGYEPSVSDWENSVEWPIAELAKTDIGPAEAIDFWFKQLDSISLWIYDREKSRL